MFSCLWDEVRAALERDPAAYHWLPVVLFYPGVHARWAHRLAHRLWVAGWRLPALWLCYTARWLTGIEIHPAAAIGSGLFIDHGMGVVIGETAVIGDQVTIYHGVTLGGVSLNTGKRHPTIGDGVVIGAGAKVLGAISVGHHTRIGANAVVVHDMPANAVVVGVPARPITRGNRPNPDLQHDNLPDLLAERLEQLRQRLEQLEQHENTRTLETL